MAVEYPWRCLIGRIPLQILWIPLKYFKILPISMEKHREFSPRSQLFGPRFWPLSFSSGFLPGARTGATPSSTVPSHIHGDSKMLKGIPRKNIKKTSRYIKQHLACQTGIDTYLMSLQQCRVAHLEANPPRWGMVWVTASASQYLWHGFVWKYRLAPSPDTTGEHRIKMIKTR